MTRADMAERAVARHALGGLRTEPLAGYLAGLGLIRLIGGQADPGATAAWTADGLVIETTVADIPQWLAEEYEPTPVLSPWNGGSGFGAKDVEPRRRLARLLGSDSPRLASFRTAAAAADAAMSRGRAAGWITGDAKVSDKQRLVQEFRNRCPDELLPWIDACVVLTTGRAQFPPLLGTGGNDGRLDFSTNFHEQLLAVLDATPKGRARSVACARDLLSGGESEPLASAPVGQFDPAGAGGQGSSPYGAAASLANPWEYVLMVEGALLFASGVARRGQHDAGRAAMPFTVAWSPDGTSSGADGEEARGEVWAPAWSAPCTLAEISQLFSEARATWRGRPARRAVDFYAATRALGVARGISEFTRYGLQQRNGLAFVAVPLDRVGVTSRPQVRLAGGIEDWVSWIPRGEAPGAAGEALRRFDRAHLRFARDGGAIDLRDMLAALTLLEMAAGRSGRLRERLRVRTPPAAADFLGILAGAESPELRIAAGVASCATRRSANGAPARSMRQILLPVDPPEPARRDARWRDTPVVPGLGIRPLRQVLASVLAWRSRTAAEDPAPGPRNGGEPGTGEENAAAFRGVPAFRSGIPVPWQDLHALACASMIDDSELEAWLLACLALDWRRTRSYCWHPPELALPVLPLVLLHPLAAGLAERGNPGAPPFALGPDWAVRLAAGRVTDVHADAARRVRQAGWDTRPALPAPQVADGTSLAAALVPRCRGWLSVLKDTFEPDPGTSAKAAVAGPGDSP